METQKAFKFRQGVRFFNFDEVSFIVDTGGPSLYNLGISSALISANLDGNNNLETIMKIIRDHYNVSVADSETAVMTFINMMQEKKLIEEAA